MQWIKYTGTVLFLFALCIFTASLFWSNYAISEDKIKVKTEYHQSAIVTAAVKNGMNKVYSNQFEFVKDLKKSIKDAQKNNQGNPFNLENEWDYKIGDWEIKNYVYDTVRASTTGYLPNNKTLIFFLTFGLAIFGGLLFILPDFFKPLGIKNNGIYHSSLTKGIQFSGRKILLFGALISTLIFGYFYSSKDIFWPLVTLLAAGLIAYLVFFRLKEKDHNPPRSASPNGFAIFGIIAGAYLIVFYILLYWFPHFILNWILLVDPISVFLSGNPASQWFLYGFMYCLIVSVMGIRMIAKYRHNKYQILRTFSVTFFQIAFAFLIPEILVRLNQPWYDFKNIWPLNYTFFFDYNLDTLMSSGGLGIFMLVWGIVLILIGVPVITYFFGKRWYCSWVCGCGGLAETMGDPFRQLSDKSLRAWRFERYTIHGVLMFAIVMTIAVLYTYFSGSEKILFLNSNSIRSWYGFLIGSAFAGVVGTGFYPLMGNRMWCRFGCPLAAYLGLVQKFKSRFRITTNGGQCISCGNCSTYCEMGIDVRWYAQRGQDIVRSSCVGCGVCSAVCPRGVLRLENASGDISSRTDDLRTVHISANEVSIL